MQVNHHLGMRSSSFLPPQGHMQPYLASSQPPQQSKTLPQKVMAALQGQWAASTGKGQVPPMPHMHGANIPGPSNGPQPFFPAHPRAYHDLSIDRLILAQAHRRLNVPIPNAAEVYHSTNRPEVKLHMLEANLQRGVNELWNMGKKCKLVSWDGKDVLLPQLAAFPTPSFTAPSVSQATAPAAVPTQVPTPAANVQQPSPQVAAPTVTVPHPAPQVPAPTVPVPKPAPLIATPTLLVPVPQLPAAQFSASTSSLCIPQASVIPTHTQSTLGKRRACEIEPETENANATSEPGPSTKKLKARASESKAAESAPIQRNGSNRQGTPAGARNVRKAKAAELAGAQGAQASSSKVVLEHLVPSLPLGGPVFATQDPNAEVDLCAPGQIFVPTAEVQNTEQLLDQYLSQFINLDQCESPAMETAPAIPQPQAQVEALTQSYLPAPYNNISGADNQFGATNNDLLWGEDPWPVDGNWDGSQPLVNHRWNLPVSSYENMNSVVGAGVTIGEMGHGLLSEAAQ
ncbi:hypothetical protein D9611_010387 [Ephemerocybe angulata]|uniref:Uncharacterized protein n=1 Tax=Ephemerocybe angulata TaxID=980116 RepID=A0A8H5BB68_9AGAR|nr:hypothetical protein D9611_010387 [Tulosesus angulatus]